MKIEVSGEEYTVRPADHGTIALAGFLALSRGEAVEIRLADGKRIGPLGFAEIEQIAEKVVQG